MAEIMIVSKPVVPPWRDSSKNLARDLATHLHGHRLQVMVAEGTPEGALGAARPVPVYPAGRSGYAPALRDNLRVFAHLLRSPTPDVYHFLFAPNPRSSAAARVCLRLRPAPSVQTLCSAPRPEADLARLLFADRIVVLSRHTRERCLAAGIAPERLAHIPPSVPPLAIPGAAGPLDASRARHGLPRDVPILLYPGDLEFGAGADRSLEVLADLPAHDVHLVVASRPKTGAAHRRQCDLRERAGAMGLAERVHFLGEVPDIHALLALATVVLLPTETLFAKMDLPLVLLEAMSLARPVLVLQGTPPAELAEQGGARAVAADRTAIAAAVTDLLSNAGARASLGARAREQVLTEHAPATMAERYRVVYEALLGASGQPERHTPADT